MTIDKASLKNRLSEESPEVRRRAVLEIAKLKPEDAIDIVVIALGDDDWRVRKEAALVASGMASSKSVVDRLVDEMVQEENISLRNAAAEALVAAGEKAITGIIERIPHLSSAGRKIAVEVLGASSDPRIMDVLINGLTDTDYNVRACAAEWLGEQGGERATEALLSCFRGKDRLLIIAALQSLNRIGAVIPWPLLEPLATRRLYGADLLLALGRSGAVEAAPVIVRGLAEDTAIAARALELLHNSSPESAAAVESALSKVDKEVLSLLGEWARDGEPAEQRAAAGCLLWSRSESLIEMIPELAQNESLYLLLIKDLQSWGPPALAGLEKMMIGLEGERLASVIGLLARLLETESGQKKIDLFAKYLESEDLVVATAAASAVARFGNERVIPRLIELAGSSSKRVRRVAGYALVEVGRRYTDKVRRKLKEVEIEGLRGIQLCRVIEAVGDSTDSPRLSGVLSSPDPELRSAALRALTRIAGAEAMEMITLAMTDEDMGVRMASAAALGQMGPAAAETIVSALHAAEGPLKAALVRALGRVGHPEAPVILRNMCWGSADVALAALEAMRELGLDADEIQGEILLHPDSEVVKQALSVLGASVSVPQLIRLLDHPGWDVRLATVDRLAPLKKDKTVNDALTTRLDEEQDDLVLGAIARALGAMGRNR